MQQLIKNEVATAGRDTPQEASATKGLLPQKTVTDAEIRELRRILHEMANLFTGILVGGGLLHHALSGDARQRYTQDLCASGERGAALVRSARALIVEPDDSAVRIDITNESGELTRATQ